MGAVVDWRKLFVVELIVCVDAYFKRGWSLKLRVAYTVEHRVSQ